MNDVDKIDRLRQAITMLLPTLPELIGGDWLAFSHNLQLLLTQLAATTDPAERKRMYDALRLLFSTTNKRMNVCGRFCVS